ncbi:xanthine dehydrogenase family protein molybdopterin-binding subunit [Dethiosulfatarculus sandiegensis]|uniref:xanthine dehydrogenase family protein molybdopterin-binding subunit n=1 Tax=Dethiosulfatarculus sandiegensis TaxID=1429043 RepID=UPI000A5D7DA2|nr:molybdopterin cofactor-binding domain-containing protein [Dethiosulfatarculus sandiegensis]
MAVGTHVSNAWPFCVDYDNAYVTVQPDGSVHIASGVPDMGTGTSTCLPQIAAEAMGVPFEMVEITYGDTETTPFEIGSHASRTCYAAGTAVMAATNDVRKQILEYAAPFFQAEPEDLMIDDAVIYRTPKPGEPEPEPELTGLEALKKGKGNAVTMEEVAYHAHVRNKQFIGLGRIVPSNAPPWHACFADVEVDTETGQVTVNKMTAAHDVGKAINPIIVKGQIEGGVVQGLGYALTEEIVYRENGSQVQNEMHNYMVPTAADIPELDSIIVESSDPTGPFGAKGAGECSLVCPASALANAVANALDLDISELPMTPERLFTALQQNRN